MPHSYETQRKYREDYVNVYELTEDEKVRIGLKKPKPLNGTIHIVIPVHYGTQGVQWQNRFVTPAELEGYKVRVPDLQIIE